MQHSESLCREKEGVVARYRESLSRVPGALSDVAALGEQAVEDMEAIAVGVEVRDLGWGGYGYVSGIKERG